MARGKRRMLKAGAFCGVPCAQWSLRAAMCRDRTAQPWPMRRLHDSAPLQAGWKKRIEKEFASRKHHSGMQAHGSGGNAPVSSSAPPDRRRAERLCPHGALWDAKRRKSRLAPRSPSGFRSILRIVELKTADPSSARLPA